MIHSIIILIIIFFTAPAWGATYTVTAGTLQSVFDDNDLGAGDIIDLQIDVSEAIVWGANDIGTTGSPVILKSTNGSTITGPTTAASDTWTQADATAIWYQVVTGTTWVGQLYDGAVDNTTGWMEPRRWVEKIGPKVGNGIFRYYSGNNYTVWVETGAVTNDLTDYIVWSSAKLTSAGAANDAYIANTVSLSTSTRMYFHYAGKSDGTNAMGVQIQSGSNYLQDDLSTWSASQNWINDLAIGTGDTTWTAKQITFPSGSTASHVVTISSGGTNGNACWVDDVWLAEPDLDANGQFHSETIIDGDIDSRVYDTRLIVRANDGGDPGADILYSTAMFTVDLNGSEYVTVQDLIIYGAIGDISNSAATLQDEITITGNTIYHGGAADSGQMGRLNEDAGGWIAAIEIKNIGTLGIGYSGVQITNNTIARPIGIGIGISGADESGDGTNIVSGNSITNFNLGQSPFASGVYLRNFDDADVYSNAVTTAGMDGSCLASIPCSGIWLDTTALEANQSDNTNVYLNTVSGLNGMLYKLECNYNINMYRNVGYDGKYGVVIGANDAVLPYDVSIYNNTFYGITAIGIALNKAAVGTASDTVIKNNIVNLTASGTAYIEKTVNYLDTVDLANNLYDSTSGCTPDCATDTLWDWNGTDYNFANWASPSGETNALVADPEMIDPSNDNFEIGSGSAAQDTGVDVGLYYCDSAPDIGYFELCGANIRGVSIN